MIAFHHPAISHFTGASAGHVAVRRGDPRGRANAGGRLSPGEIPSRAVLTFTKGRWRCPGVARHAHRRGSSPATAASSASAGGRPAVDDDVWYHELPCRVYIEHTDAYQVMYHANYFRFLWRGREAFLFGDVRPGVGTPSAHEALSGWATAPVVAIDECKFVSPAVLGDDLTVRTRVVSAGTRTVTLRQEVVSSADGALKLTADVVVAPLAVDGSPAAIPATFRVAHGLSVDDADVSDSEGVIIEDLAEEGDATSDVSTPLVDTRVTMYEEELSLGLSGGASEADVLRWFERNRTEAIGGADALASLKEEGGVIVVVSAMTAGRFGSLRCGERRGRHPEGRQRMHEATVRSTVELRRRNLQVVFKQRLLVPSTEKDSEAEVVAAAEVTCTCLARDSGRPVPCPPALIDTFVAARGRELVPSA